MIILYGENLVLSRQKLNELIGNFKGEKVRLDGRKLNLGVLKQALESASLFNQKRLVILENIFSRPPSQEKEKILAYLKKVEPENLLVWEPKKIDGRTLNSFKKAKTIKFSLTAFIFKFLDAFAPDNKKGALFWLRRCFDQDSPEIVFYLLARRIGHLLIAKDLGKKGLLKMAPWQQSKLLHQASKFETKTLLFCHHQLLEIDWQQKTGQAFLPLASQLDLLVASI